MRGTKAMLMAAACLGVVPSAMSAEPTRAEVLSAGEKFRKTCLHCHQAPDLRFDTDRTWHEQLRRTA
jgi:hypothetical protein